jgi:hypothetical protein
MPRKTISDKPMTSAERMARQRERIKKKLALLALYQERFGPLVEQHEEGEKK